MKVRDLTVCNAGACTPETSLARAGAILRRSEVGTLPVVDRDDRVIGTVTDRELLLEIARRNAPPSEILVESVMSERPAVCSPQDDVLDVLAIMRRNRVRLLPVVDEDDRLEGVLSIDEIVAQAADGRDDTEVPLELLIDTLAEIGGLNQSEPRSRSRGNRERVRDEDELDGRGRRLRPGPNPDRRARIARSR
jgi:CBS domain-containing protein